MARILIIDDEEIIRFTTKYFLNDKGHEVYTADGFEAGIEIISKNEVDLILVDIILGSFCGIDILREVKFRKLRCPVIVITGQPSLETATDSVRLGAFDYLTKPIQKDTLLRVTKMALDHKELLDEKYRIEKENERYRSNMEAIFRSINDGFITVDEQCCVIEANQSIKEICGLDPQMLIGAKFNESTKYCQCRCIELLNEVLEKRKTVEAHRIECKNQIKPGQLVSLTSSPLLDHNREFMGMVLVIKDRTRMNELEQKLKVRHKFHNIIGESQKMQEIYRLLDDLADIDTTVLVTGESGTGKELVAEALHYGGLRSQFPLVKINCSAIPESLFESELFGHIKGAFTGAISDKKGRLQMADKGTILLDEIGDMSPAIQLKLLRFLQDKKFERVGDSNSVCADVRVIAATNRDLKSRIRFREDLYYRLNIIEIKLPALRERTEDITLLVDHFCEKFNYRYKKKIEGLSDRVMAMFMHYPWPGNIRELEHAIEHAFILCHENFIVEEHLPAEIRNYLKKLSIDYKDESDDKRGYDEVLRSLESSGWNKAKAARILGITRQTLYRYIERYGLVEK